MNRTSPDTDDISDILQTEFAFPDLTGRNILIIGVGGGCDIISAYAVSEVLKRHGAQKTVYANTKRRAEPSLESLSRNVFRVPAEVRPVLSGESTHGGTRIDQSLPRGDDGCPLIFRLNKEPERAMMLVQEIDDLGFDMIISVDTGADSIVKDAESGMGGRDKTMMHILGRLPIHSLHMVVGPGCDGETTMADLAVAFRELADEGKYEGWFSLESVVPLFARLSEGLDRTRTPNIIVDAFANRLQTVPGRPDLKIVPRGPCPAIPRAWLTRAFVLKP